MKQIVYTVEIKFLGLNGKEVKITTHGSTSKEIQKRISGVLSEKSKWNLLNLFKLK